MNDAISEQRAEAQRWVQALASIWNEVPIAELPGRVSDLFSPDVRFSQPLSRSTRGLRYFARDLAALQTLVPDLSGRNVGWAVGRGGEVVYVEFELTGTIGCRSLRLHSCDRIVLQGGVAVERHAFLDPLPLLWAIVTQPLLWPRALRSYLRLMR